MNEHPNYYLAPQRHKFVQQQQQQQARRWTRREYNLMQGRGASPTLELTSSKATFYIVNSSVDSGLVSSPTYQNLPCQRRPPPPPPRSPSPELKPPVLPPRKYRESQQSSIMEKSVPSASVSLQNSTKPSAFPTEKNRISVIPLHKLQSEENQVDSTKRDFKSLMTQWENSSPREDNYAAELRKQAKKFSGTQQQPNSMPAAYERTKPKISFATTYKHEPMQPQEATSPVSSSFTAFTASQLPSTVSNSSMPSSSSLPPSGYKTSNISASLSQGVPSASSNTHHQHTKLANTPRNVPVVNSMGYTASSSSPGTVAQTKSPEKTKVPDDYRNRSSSDVAPDKHQASEGPYLSGQGLSTTTRDRSSSDHDILSERRPQNQSFQASAKQAPQTVSKWLPGRGAPEHQPTKPQARSGQLVEIVSMTDARHPTQGFETVQNLEETLGFDKYGDNERFADESYIGHKNKSSRAIGTYKRSKSAVLQSGPNNNNYQVAAGDEESSAFQEQKLGQQPWSSESVLSRTDEPGAQVGAAGGDRFAKPSVHGRHSVGQPPVSSSISQSNSPSSVPSSAPPGIFTYRPFVKEQPSSGASRESQRHAASSALIDPSFDSSKSSSRGKVEGVPRSTNSFQMPGEDAQRKHFNNPSGHSPQRWNSSADDLKSTQIWNPPGNSYAEKSLPSSSQDGILHSRSSGYSSLNSDSARSTQNIYQRRDSSPIKSASPASSPVSKLGAPSEDLNSISRRCSDSGISSTQRSEYSCHDVSTTSHSRQPSQEELECDEKAMQLAQELEDKDQKLSEVLRSDANKKRMQYMNGLFSESMEEPCQVEKSSVNQETRASVRTARSPRHSVDESIDKESSKRGSLPKEYWMSPSKALLEMELRKNEEASKDLTKDISDSRTLMKHKEELMEKLHKKLIVLKEEKVSLQKEVSDNNLLGQQVCLVIDAKCQSHSEKDKFKTCIDDLEKIVRLLLNLSGQLARAQNAVQALRPDADAKVKKLTIDKRERLSAKHEEAKLLKEDIDKRSEQLAGMLRERLNDKEFSDYTHFVKMKSKLTIDMQELDDKITLGEEQILELRKSIPDVAES